MNGRWRFECPEVFFNNQQQLNQQLNGGDFLVLNQSFTELSTGRSEPPSAHGTPNSYRKSATVPNTGEEVLLGSGENYLSNEIFYRTGKVRKENQPGLLTGHLHIRQLAVSGTVPTGVPPTMTGDEIYTSVKDALNRFLNALKRLTFPDTKVTAQSTSSVTLTNNTPTPIEITSSSFISGLTVFQLMTSLPVTIAAGASSAFQFKFLPVDAKNYIDTVQLKDTTDKVLFCVQLEGKGIDPLVSIPATVNFPDTVINRESSIGVRIKNVTATQTITVSSADSNPPFSRETVLPVTIGPGPKRY